MHAAMTNQQLIDSGNQMMDKTDQAIGGHKRLDYLSWSFCEEISFIYFGELKRDKFRRLFWSVIIISSHSSLFPCRRLWVALYLVCLKRTSLFSSALSITCTVLYPDLNKLWNVFTVQKSMESLQKKNKFSISLFVVDCSRHHQCWNRNCSCTQGSGV